MTNRKVTPANIEKVEHLAGLLLEAQMLAFELQIEINGTSNLDYMIMVIKTTVQDYQKSLEDTPLF